MTIQITCDHCKRGGFEVSIVNDVRLVLTCIMCGRSREVKAIPTKLGVF